MTRLIVVAVTLAAALVVLLVWIAGGASDQVRERDEILDPEGRNRIKERAGGSPVDAPPKGRDRREENEILRINLPGTDPRVKRGGPRILSLRGNQVYFCRRDPGSLRWQRGVLDTAHTEAAIAAARNLSGSGAGPAWEVSVVAPDERAFLTRTASGENVESLLAAIQAQEKPWIPTALNIRLREAEDPGSPALQKPWPRTPGMPLPETLLAEAGWVRGPDILRRTLLDILNSGDVVFEDEEGRLFGVAELTAELP